MSIKKYVTFLKVVETGSITKAASALGHTQSGVTQLLSSLEQDLGVQLITRSRNGIALTDEGERLYPFLEDVIASNERLLAEVKQLNAKQDTLIRIGAFTSVAVNWLPTIIKEYQKKEPDVRFELIDCGYNELEQELKKQSMDLGFIPMSAAKELECVPLHEDRLLAVLPKDHPYLTEHPGISSFPVSLFAKYPTISLIPEIDLDARTVFNKEGIKPNTKYVVEDDYAMLALAKKGLGICVVPELMLGDDAYDNIVALELDPPATRTIGIAFPSSTKRKASVQTFAKFIQDWVSEQAQ